MLFPWTKPFIRGLARAFLPALFLVAGSRGASAADSVVVFNEIMYHPRTNETALEWLELYNPMAVAVDLSGWSIVGGIDFTFPEAAIIAGGGYVVVALSPADLTQTSDLTNVFGPFSGRLSNGGEQLELRNNNNRLMDEVAYGVEGDWPVGPDGAGVSLAKRNEGLASRPAASWTSSARMGGTPGLRNFAAEPFVVTVNSAVEMGSTWHYEASGQEPGDGWTKTGFDQSAWLSGEGLFQAGNLNPPLGEPESVPTVFSTGVDAEGKVLPPGASDPHYQLIESAQSAPPPPAISATVIQNHPAWFPNDARSSWIGPLNPGTANSAAGSYTYRTRFSLEGFDPSSVALSLSAGADNRLNNVLLNGVSTGIGYVGFSEMSRSFNLGTGFSSGLNTLDFLVVNDGGSPNPSGFRADLAATGRKRFSVGTTVPFGQTSYFFRTQFMVDGPPRQTALTLGAVVADGAVFYLNGAEVLRVNLPSGPITASTLAVSNVPTPINLGPFPVPTAGLISGANVLAVEIHQAAGGNNDVLFGASLSLTTTNILVPPPVALAFNEFSSATNSDFWVELANYGPSEIDLADHVLERKGGASREFVFPPTPLGPGQFLQVERDILGFGTDPGDRLILYSPDRMSVLDAVVTKRQPRGRWPDGTGRWFRSTELTPGRSNRFEFRDEIVINEIMYHPPGIPPVDQSVSAETVLPITATWRYNQTGANLGTGWIGTGFDDSAWPEGPALLYVEDAALPASKRTPLMLGPITYYFRSSFVFSGSTNGLELRLRTVLDDGAIFYLNGREILRVNMPGGDIHHLTLASTGIGDAALSEPLILPPTDLIQGTNILAVEVHQASENSSDIVFGAELVAAYAPGPDLSYQESLESWVELLNRSAEAVDLAGWSLSGDIGYAFDPGTVLPSGGYLVVAAEPALVRSNYPAISVAGPFTGRLRRNSSSLVLLDPNGNASDEVRYFDGKPWPNYADGGGSSLELRDPWADNSKAESWAASRESLRSTWSRYTYRGIANNNLGPVLWQEFVLGLLDAGECLIDDVSVLESPSGAAIELLQNGSFETGVASWRPLGTHGHSRVVVDPDNPANRVLHLVATGPTEHMHNHLETTLAAGRSVVNGREYQISFRARWLAGNNSLNTRLYFNRVAKTTRLDIPQRHGTPGAPNSVLASNIGPTYQGFAHSPIIPQPGQPVAVRVSASDPDGVSAMTLFWSVNGGPWQSSPMLPEGPAILEYRAFVASIPSPAAGAVVQFYVQGTDGRIAVSTFPPSGPDSRALFKVDDGKPVMPQLHRLRLWMTSADAEFLHAPTNVMSNDRLGLTVVYDEREVFYDVGVHLQGSERGRNDSSRVGFTVRFQSDHLFRGVHNGLAADKSGGYSGLGGKHDEILLWHAINHAGRLPGMYNDLAQVFAPRSREDGTAQVRLAAYGREFLDTQFRNGNDGELYKLELIYYPTTTVTGSPESHKLPQPDNVVNMDIQNWGSDPENYRWIFRQENHADRDDYSRLIALNQAFSLTGPEFESRTAELLDVDEWMRALAFLALIGAGDIFSYGLNHNFVVFFRPEDQKAMAFLFDMDYQFVQPISYGFPGSGSPNTFRLATLPNNLRRYYHHLLDLTTTTVNSEYLRPWASHYSGLLGQNWNGAVDYLVQRASYVRSRMPLSTPFAITTNGGRDFETFNDQVTLTGTAPLAVSDLQVNGLPYAVRWTALTNWSMAVPLTGFSNSLSVLGLDKNGNPLAGAADSITVTNRGTLALRPVVINEWMADNAGPGGLADPSDNRFQDWFELYNPNNVPIDLSGSFLTDTLSIPTLFQVPSGTEIGPRGFLLVWADNEPQQNGGGDGSLHVNFQLSKSSDAIALFASDGTLQHSVAFEDQIENVSQGLYPDGDATSRLVMPDWSPGAANRPGQPSPPQFSAATLGPEGALSLQFSSIPGRTYSIEYKMELSAPAWTPLAPALTATNSLLELIEPIHSEPRRFYRVLLVP